ncbi:MAG: hypothetical protein EXR77_09990 [Myxococcales bacterium]|nr:hypothetical protein [Myxococcales bacterium]
MQSPVAFVSSMFNVAGGLRYHLAALRFRRTLWAPYTLQVAAILQQWPTAVAHLVIVGPSAGWHLNPEFLGRFAQVTAIEPDPIARWLLRWRFPLVHWQFDTSDYFTPYGSHNWTDNTLRLLHVYPDSAVLFANVLGQFIGLYPYAVAQEHHGELLESPTFTRWKLALTAALSERSWLSLHDRLSSDRPPVVTQVETASAQPSSQLAQTFWPENAQTIDHFTAGIGGAGQRRFVVWQRKPSMFHVIEAIGDRNQ